nr:uncharacterized protein LOC124809495 [Hydra vulgaris]
MEICNKRVPQGSVFGPLLFILYINDLPDYITHHIKIYADDCKIIAVLKSDKDKTTLKIDIDNLVDRSHKWNMPLNFDKCKVMHVGRGNSKFVQNNSMLNFNGNRIQLDVTKHKHDLGVLLSGNLKVCYQDESAAAKPTVNLVD